MLPANNRLKNKKDFEKVFKDGRGFKSGFLFLKAARNGKSESRFGFIVSKKFSTSAVSRNKMRRRLKEAARRKLPGIKKGFDLVFSVRKTGEEVGMETVRDNLEIILKKSGLEENPGANRL